MMAAHTEFSDNTALAEHVAGLWIERLAARDSRHPFTVALSGGRIPKLLYQAVTQQVRDVSFRNVHFFWGDERVVAPSDDDSNYKLAAVRLLQALKIPEDCIHRIVTDRGDKFAIQQAKDEVCRVAELDSEGQPKLDLVFLGMGEDGHVASLFPDDTEALESKAVYRAVTSPKPPPRRITLGFPALAAAHEVWVLASGEGKAEALRQSQTAIGNTPLAKVLHDRTHTEIFTDFDLG